VNGQAFTKFANGRGRLIIRIAELNSGPGGSTQYSDVTTTPSHIAFPDDIVFSWSGSLGVYRWHRDEALINQHIFKVIPRNVP
jgi:type I restriction enzyme S subunit